MYRPSFFSRLRSIARWSRRAPSSELSSLVSSHLKSTCARGARKGRERIRRGGNRDKNGSNEIKLRELRLTTGVSPERINILEVTIIKINVIHARAIKEIASLSLPGSFLSMCLNLSASTRSLMHHNFLFNEQSRRKKSLSAFSIESSLKTESILVERIE